MVSQKILNDQMRADSLRRQRRESETRPLSETRHGRTVITAVLSGESELAKALQAMIDLDRPGKSARAGDLLNATGLTTRVMAHLSMKALVDMLPQMSPDMSRTSCCIGIANRIHEEWRLRHFEEKPNRAALLDKLLRDLASRQVKRVQARKTVQLYFKAERVSWQGWTISEKIMIGAALLYAVRDATGLFALTDKARVVPAEELTDALRRLSDRQAMRYVRHLPRLAPPIAWTPDNIFAGGYAGDLAVPFVKASGRRDAARLTAADWSRVLPAVNAIQATPWRVNRDMLAAVEWAFDTLASQPHYQELGKLPRSTPAPFDPVPASDDEDIIARYRHACFKTHERNRLDRAPRARAEFTVRIARQLADAPAIYYPHNVDTRGRAYPVASFLNPQAADYGRAMLEFAEGRALDTPDAEAWFRIAGANAFGFDKAPLSERVDWTVQQEVMILGVAADFQHDRRWTFASKPFQFLAFCFAYRDWRADPAAFRSHLPVSVDATASGLQHYAGLLLNRELAARVNVTPSPTRADIYGEVAAAVRAKCAGHPWGDDWISFGLDRSTCKTQVMTVPYSLTKRGCRLQLWAWLDSRLIAGYATPWKRETPAERADHKARVLWLDALIWSSIQDVVGPAQTCMNWIAKLAKAHAKDINAKLVGNPAMPPEDMAMCWTTSDGFPVATCREQESLRSVETKLNGTLRVQLRYYQGKHRLSLPKMANSVAPNLIHSLDATLLRMAVLRGVEIGVTDYGVTHDAFALPAPEVARFLTSALKPAFISLYDNYDVLGDLARDFAAVFAEPPPARGDLDLAAVADSQFFFS